MVSRFTVYLVSLDPTQGSEITKTRPCLIISPDEMNQTLRTVIVAPMTTTLRNVPSRVKTTFQGKKGDIVLDQMRAVDKVRLAKKLGSVHSGTATKVLAILQEMFS
ncbi:MAG: type II toxin-antitoxin system PemK/MazF family toxin [Nitrospirales bacterium]|nr:type II toxin-antitoxin system PemK/MazF family toxin [Nitrospirales bacterium]